MTPSELDMASTCQVRTLLMLGCRKCSRRKECIRFKFSHNGVTPYEYHKEEKESKEEKDDEEI